MQYECLVVFYDVCDHVKRWIAYANLVIIFTCSIFVVDNLCNLLRQPVYPGYCGAIVFITGIFIRKRKGDAANAVHDLYFMLSDAVSDLMAYSTLIVILCHDDFLESTWESWFDSAECSV